MAPRRVRWFPILLVLNACSSTDLPIPQPWLSTPATTVEDRRPPLSTADLRIDKEPTGDVLMHGTQPLTPAFAAIDSFDLQSERREVAFSAKRKDNFDVGLVALEGSAIHWVPEEPQDEVMPRWAERGNKFAYVIRNSNGDLVRTIHVPTSFQLTVDFPNAVINDIAWDAASERILVTYETPDASEQTNTVRYNGEERRPAKPPAARLPVALEPFGVETLLLRPNELRYGERIPVVLWLTGERFNRWSDARAALLKDARIACVVTTRSPDDAVWQRIRQTPWMDAKRVFVVDTKGQVAATATNATTIRADTSVPTGRYRRSHSSILVAPAVVESFAVGFIRRELNIDNKR